MPYFVYILYSEEFDKYYIGQTNSLEHRLERHNEFDLTNSYTSKYRPWVLKAFVEIGESRSDAMKVERRLKASKSKKTIADFAKNPEKLVGFAQKVLSPDTASH
ncbi:MAG: GIY-YIG nuclease family protein [Saprospiraceae bacterium]